MAKLIKSIFLIIILSLSGCSFYLNNSKEGSLELKKLRGGYYNLKNINGKYTLLHFWSTWCKMCKHELLTLQNLSNMLNRPDFEVITVAIDSPTQDILELMENYNISLTTLLDSDDKAKNYYRITDVPATVLFNKEGKMMRFRDPDSGKTIKRTKGPQSWDKPDVINYFRSGLPR